MKKTIEYTVRDHRGRLVSITMCVDADEPEAVSFALDRLKWAVVAPGWTKSIEHFRQSEVEHAG